MTTDSKRAAIWLQLDSRDLYRVARAYQDCYPSVAKQTQEHAAYISKLARMEMGVGV